MQIRNRSLAVALAGAVVLALPALASAHVTVHPNSLPAGGYTVVDVNVPNEEDKADTTKVEIQLPPGFSSASPVPVAGWTAKVTTSKLATPIQTDDGPIDTQVDTIAWTADGKGLPPGQFVQFPVSILIPDKAGTALTFKALQTYSGGEVVRWIGAPGTDHPAPQVGIAQASAPVLDFPAGAPGTVGAKGVAPGGSTTTASAPAAPAAPAASKDDGGDDTLAIVAIVVGALALIAALVAIAQGRARGRTAGA